MAKQPYEPRIEPEKAPDALPETVDCIVAKGRTVVVNGKNFGPGAAITLPREEALSLRALGFLADDGVAVIATGDGPTFTTPEGVPSINKVA